MPTEFKMLVNELVTAGSLKQASEQLVQAKEQEAELAYGPRIPAISDLIDKEMERFESKQFSDGPNQRSVEPLNHLFRVAALREVWA